MKAASGELSLTVITIVAIGLVVGFFTWFFNGPIKNKIERQWDTMGSENGENGGHGGSGSTIQGGSTTYIIIK